MDYIEIPDGQHIRYELIEGNRDYPCLVFLHEGLGCIEMWRDFPQKLCSLLDCEGLLYDRTGYGKSSPEQNKRDLHYLHGYANRELPAVLGSLIPAREHILFGHSDGGSIGLIHGARSSPLLKGIITEAAHVFVEEVTVEGIKDVVRKYGEKGPRGLESYHGKRAGQVFRAWSETWLSDWFRGWNIEDTLPSVTCPVLAIQGANDAYGTAKQVEAIVSGVSGPADSVLIPDCGHAPHIELPEHVLNVVAKFITPYRK